MEKLSQVPQLSALTRDSTLFKSSPVYELTESETEYNVKCIKHVFSDYLVLQFDCVNTLSDQLLENVRVTVDSQDMLVQKNMIHIIYLSYLSYNKLIVQFSVTLLFAKFRALVYLTTNLVLVTQY